MTETIKLTSLGQNVDIATGRGTIHVEIVKDGAVITLPHVPIVAFTLQTDQQLFDWVTNAADEKRGAGSFVRYFAQAAQVADYENYPELVVTLLKMKIKYPEYCEPSWKLDSDSFLPSSGTGGTP